MKLYDWKSWAGYVSVCAAIGLMARAVIDILTSIDDVGATLIDAASALAFYTVGYLLLWPIVKDPAAFREWVTNLFRRKKKRQDPEHRKRLLEQCLMDANTHVYKHPDFLHTDRKFIIHKGVVSSDGGNLMEEVGVALPIPFALNTYVPGKEMMNGLYLDGNFVVLAEYEYGLGFVCGDRWVRNNEIVVRFGDVIFDPDASWVPIDELRPVDSFKYLLLTVPSFIEKYQYVLSRLELDEVAKAIFEAEVIDPAQEELPLILMGNGSPSWEARTEAWKERTPFI